MSVLLDELTGKYGKMHSKVWGLLGAGVTAIVFLVFAKTKNNKMSKTRNA